MDFRSFSAIFNFREGGRGNEIPWGVGGFSAGNEIFMSHGSSHDGQGDFGTLPTMITKTQSIWPAGIGSLATIMTRGGAPPTADRAPGPEQPPVVLTPEPTSPKALPSQGLLRRERPVPVGARAHMYLPAPTKMR